MLLLERPSVWMFHFFLFHWFHTFYIIFLILIRWNTQHITTMKKSHLESFDRERIVGRSFIVLYRKNTYENGNDFKSYETVKIEWRERSGGDGGGFGGSVVAVSDQRNGNSTIGGRKQRNSWFTAWMYEYTQSYLLQFRRILCMYMQLCMLQQKQTWKEINHKSHL